MDMKQECFSLKDAIKKDEMKWFRLNDAINSIEEPSRFSAIVARLSVMGNTPESHEALLEIIHNEDAARQAFIDDTPRSREVLERQKILLRELVKNDPIPCGQDLSQLAYTMKKLCYDAENGDKRFSLNNNCNPFNNNVRIIQKLAQGGCLPVSHGGIRVMDLVKLLSVDWFIQTCDLANSLDNHEVAITQFIECDFYYQYAYRKLIAENWQPEKDVKAQSLGDGGIVCLPVQHNPVLVAGNVASATGATVVCDTEESLADAARKLCAGHNGIIQGLWRDYPQYRDDIPEELTEEAASLQLKRDKRINRRKVGRQWYVNSDDAKRVIDEKINVVKLMDKVFADADKMGNKKPQEQEVLYKGPNERF